MGGGKGILRPGDGPERIKASELLDQIENGLHDNIGAPARLLSRPANYLSPSRLNPAIPNRVSSNAHFITTVVASIEMVTFS